ncbi:MAG: four helix bundle protein [Bacteroidales bacterium]|nr:four helix bundle protein [Bacteroidales bacterium]
MSDFGDFLMEKAMSFSIRIVKLYSYLKDEKKEYVLSKQMLRSGTSIGANLAEAQCAISKKDFLAKAYISLKESSETLYWITLLYKTNYLTEEQYKSIYSDCEELKKLLMSITKNTIVS